MTLTDTGQLAQTLCRDPLTRCCESSKMTVVTLQTFS